MKHIRYTKTELFCQIWMSSFFWTDLGVFRRIKNAPSVLSYAFFLNSPAVYLKVLSISAKHRPGFSGELRKNPRFYKQKATGPSPVAKSRGRGARTPIYGFGDRCSTIELFPYQNTLSACFIIIARVPYSVNKFFPIFTIFSHNSKILPLSLNQLERLPHIADSVQLDPVCLFQLIQTNPGQDAGLESQLHCLVHPLLRHGHCPYLSG